MGPPPIARKSLSWQQTFVALKHRNYRLWFIGQTVSLIGTWMQTTAQGFLIFQLTHSSVYLGYVGFASGLPSWLFMLYGGVIADRVPRRNLMVITQSVMMILAFILATLTFLNIVQPWHIILLALLLGTANAFDAPARLALVPELVEREDLSNAIALNASMFNLGTVIGPAIAGVAYALAGPAWCFTLNGISFIAVIAALLLMQLPPHIFKARTTSALSDIKEGIRYILANDIILTVITIVAVTTLFGLALVTLMPAWAVKILGGDATTNGWLQSARGLGALGGALMVAALVHFKVKGKLVAIGSFVLPLCLLLFTFMRWLPLSLATLAGAGLGMIMIFNSSNALVQSQIPDELRGRVMSVYSLIFFGSMPLGALLAGSLAEFIGEPLT
ncbi:MAG: MFS transporter, partial [Chloroflexi bacterium]|nr:MFS transporter [Chloroflexota bacterium]